MIIKQRGLFLASLAVLLLFSSITFNILNSTVSYASYPPNADGKCNDNQAPKEKNSQGEAACADDQKAPVAGQGQQDEQKGQDSTDDSTNCAVEKIGWILCPIIEQAAKMSDRLFNFLAGSLLEIEPELFNANPKTGPDTGTYGAWSKAKDLANIAFIVAFVIIVISQVTSFGISNYGIKRMLPRLIIAAILVNVSYFICQGMADLSNILGYNIHQALTDMAKATGPVPFGQTSIDNQTSGGILGKIALGILAVAGIVWLLIAPFGAVVLFILVTVLTIVVILLLRKAFIVLLVVLSPLAFVAYLLPNTEQYFRKWLSMFWKLLLVFPIVALLLGGGQLASAIILAAGATESVDTKVSSNCKSSDTGTSEKSIDDANPCEGVVDVGNGKAAKLSLGLIATGVAVAPLLAVWSVLQGALSAAGAIGGKMAAAVSRAQDRQKGKLGEASKKRREFLGNKIQTKALSGEGIAGGKLGAGIRYGARRRGKYTAAKADYEAAQGIYNNAARAGTDVDPSQVAERLRANRAASSHAFDEQETKGKEALLQERLRDTRGAKDELGNIIKDEDKIGNALKQAIEDGDKAGVQAATNMLMSMGGPGRDKLRESMGDSALQGKKGAADFRAHIAANHSSLKSTDADVYAAATDSESRSLAFHQMQMGTYSGLTNDQLATQSTSSLKTTGARSAINSEQDIVDEKGNRYKVTRGTAILGSKAGTEIKGGNRDLFT